MNCLMVKGTNKVIKKIFTLLTIVVAAFVFTQVVIVADAEPVTDPQLGIIPMPAKITSSLPRLASM